jgi:hypothetical protein
MHRFPRLLRLGLLLTSVAGMVRAADTPGGVTLTWLDGAAPTAADGVSWGVPWPKGALQKSDSLTLKTASGQSVPMQTWPLAFWPDGSVKWSGQAIATGAGLDGPLHLAIGAGTELSAPLTVTRTTAAVEIDTGAVRAEIPLQGPNLIGALWVGGRQVAQDGKLIALREDRSRYASERIVQEEDFASQIETVDVEQGGPVRAVVKITGKHKAAHGDRLWLPFVVRLYFFRGSPAIRIVHSFIYDGDPDRDQIKGLGMSFAVPFKEELQNRHFRFVGDGAGVWRQPVRMLPGYRSQAGAEIGDLYETELEGQRVPNLAALSERSRSALLTVPVWGDAKLTQIGPNSFSIYKRTTTDGSWLHVTDGHRAQGLAVLADVSGGMAVSLKHFWEKHPSAIEITNAATARGEMKVWFWSPEGGAMDLRRYDTEPHGLSVNYEDWKPGWGTPVGIANTADLTLWALGAMPSDQTLLAMAQEGREPPMLVCAPEYYHNLQVFGHWSLPDRSTPTLNWVENQVGGLVNFYRDQVDERSWYGFWDFGDIMHNYDFGRHEWRYDVGGWAWANTELMPDMLLWYSFLRTGRPDLYRMAEAMTRQTSEVEVYHLGPFAPLGSRHNVNHWGDGAKQPRISHSGLKQFYYFLSTDERVGDLMHEQLTADLTYEGLKKYNGSHYVPTPDGGARLDTGGRNGYSRNPPPPAPRPENLPPRPAVRTAAATAGLEWMCYAMNWMMEWQRTGEVKWRDRVLGDMKAMSAGLKPGDRLPGSYFDMIFGGPENLYEMEPMFDVPEFWRAWANTSEAVGRQVNGSQMTGPRMLGYAAYKKHDAVLGRMAWDKLIGTSLPPASVPKRVTGLGLLKPVTDPAFLGEPVGWQLHGVASVQWALNAIETLEFAKAYLPDWEQAHGVQAAFGAGAPPPVPAPGNAPNPPPER